MAVQPLAARFYTRRSRSGTTYNAAVGAVAELEREFAAWQGAAGAVAAGFGRAALRLAVEAALPPGGSREVLVPDFTCAHVLDAVRAAGARPGFYPVTRELRVPAEAFCARLGAATAAAILPHYFGEVLLEIEELVAACRAAGVLAIEDCALALGATDARGRRAGSFGELAAFSFTKSDWCYGGGMATANSAALAGRLGELAAARLAPDDARALRYGLLRWLDTLGNRPRWAGIAAFAGPRLERRAFPGAESFFDAGSAGAAMAPRAARRARRILERLESAAVAREHRRDLLTAALVAAPRLLHPAEARRRQAGAWFLLAADGGRAGEWRDRAAAAGVTLRLSWPAYTRPEPGQASAETEWLARHLLVLELHPELTAKEVLRIARVLRKLEQANGG
jgi:dTDP-4-amino-4,6-dideoxygalactose transaminase